MGIEEGEEDQAKGIGTIFNKLIAENFPSRYMKPLGLQTDMTKIEPFMAYCS
jgi:hypothetical protein